MSCGGDRGAGEGERGRGEGTLEGGGSMYKGPEHETVWGWGKCNWNIGAGVMWMPRMRLLCQGNGGLHCLPSDSVKTHNLFIRMGKETQEN